MNPQTRKCVPFTEGNPTRYQAKALQAFFVETAMPVADWSFVNTVCGEMCLYVPHMRITAPTKLEYPYGVCIYCGRRGSTRDHITPVTWTGETARRSVATVPACGTCNTLLGDVHASSITERRAIAKVRLRRKFAGVLRTRDWSKSELSEFDDGLRRYIEGQMSAKAEVIQIHPFEPHRNVPRLPHHHQPEQGDDMTDHEFKAPERTARAVSKDGCGYNLYEPDGSDYPCDRPAVGHRWYQDVVEHEDVLDVACEIHRNSGGDRMAALLAEVERLTGERDRARGLAARLEEQVARVEALAVAVDNRMMATAKPAEIWAALRGEGACEGSPLCPGDTHTEGCYSLAWTDAERQQCTDARCLTPCTECARAALAEAHVAEFERLRAVVTRMEALADWHETKADKAMLFPGDGNVLIATKAATVHRDAAIRLRAALTEAGDE